MDYTKLIYDYLEGELQIADEQKLFSELSYNDELREEFHDNLRFESLVQSEVSTVSTPVETTNKVFSSLGFKIPTAESSGFFNKMSKPVLALLIFLITLSGVTGSYFLYDSYFGSENSDFTENNQIPVVNSEEINQSNLNENNSKANADFSKNENSFYLAENVQNYLSNFSNIFSDYGDRNDFIKSSGYYQKNDKTNDFSLAENKFFEKLKVVNISDFKMMQNNFDLNNYISNQSGFVLVPVNIGKYNAFSELNDKYSVITKGAINTNYPGIEELNINKYNSFEIAFWYNFSDNNSLGVEFGRQVFSQEFTTNSNINYLQAPNVFFISASYKRYLLDNEILSLLMPYSSVSAGATSVGPLFRLEAGTEIRISNNLHFIVGAEGNTLFYNVDNNIYNSKNVGIIYGVKFNF